MARRTPEIVSISLAMVCGLALRWWMVHRFAIVQGDSLIYGRIAANWLQHGVYSFSEGASLRPTLIRLPGYPLFLAAIFSVTGIGNYLAVLRAQIAVDLATCGLIALFVRDWLGAKEGRVALWLAALCPFTATYVAAPLTETLSIFCVALGLLSAGRCLLSRCASWRWLAVLAFALAYAILLRPDGGLLAAALVGYLFVAQRSSATRAVAWRNLALVCVLTLLPLVPWTARNWRTFQVIQPLAPRYANDAGELPEAGYKAWVKTWFGDAVSNEEFYWCADDCPLRAEVLPARAFDDAVQRQRTTVLLTGVNEGQVNGGVMSAEDDAAFASLAQERAAAHPWRSHLGLPVLRLTDMLLRPRTELFPVPARWWAFREHARVSWFALAYAALNFGYVALAVAAFLRRRVPLAGMLLGYVVLRCFLLLTLENAEPRYTLEFFPILIAACASCFAQRKIAQG